MQSITLQYTALYYSALHNALQGSVQCSAVHLSAVRYAVRAVQCAEQVLMFLLNCAEQSRANCRGFSTQFCCADQLLRRICTLLHIIAHCAFNCLPPHHAGIIRLYWLTNLLGTSHERWHVWTGWSRPRHGPFCRSHIRTAAAGHHLLPDHPITIITNNNIKIE
jgi:hypothetical protein